ncbi:hypothetical protein TIFTF001_015585 [Ficus carica]|uniref:Uncharacterized protein n=1 Tax=Ficus carica TaxID=3494 RepID=A0AA88D6N3_FICCA|nr:hypothetical protein TIFTF001_015585 [Ficus carica]
MHAKTRELRPKPFALMWPKGSGNTQALVMVFPRENDCVPKFSITVFGMASYKFNVDTTWDYRVPSSYFADASCRQLAETASGYSSRFQVLCFHGMYCRHRLVGDFHRHFTVGIITTPACDTATMPCAIIIIHCFYFGFENDIVVWVVPFFRHTWSKSVLLLGSLSKVCAFPNVVDGIASDNILFLE